MQKTSEYQALLYASAQVGCPICRLADERVERYLETWKYELFTDVEMRKQLQHSQGFCHTHTWQLVKMGASLPLAQAYRDIVTDTIEQLQSRDLPSQPVGRLSRTILGRLFDAKRQPPPCPACIQREKAEANTIDTLRKILPDEAFYATFVTSQGLCLPHLRLTCTLKPGEWLILLCKAQIACLQRLDQQLGEMIRKHDYHFKDEEQGAEMLSWQQVASFVAGEE